MKKQPIPPQDWRQSIGFSMATLARTLGIEGNNPSRTWQRYEKGEREPPIAIICKVEEMSSGRVTSTSWMRVREAFIDRKKTRVSA